MNDLNAPNLSFYLSKWNLTNSKLLAQTPTSHVYLVQQENKSRVLKVLTEEGIKYESDSAYFLEAMQGHSVVSLIEFDKGAQLLDYVEGETLEEYFKNHSDTKSTKIICEVLKKVHSYQGPIPKQMNDLEFQFHSLFPSDENKFDDNLFYEGQEVAKELINSECDKRLLHGDVHHRNILHSKEYGWVLIDPQAFYGERNYDIANCFFNPYVLSPELVTEERILEMATIFSKELLIDRSRVLKFAFAHGTLSACWAMECNNSPARRMQISKRIKKLL
jgi:streptomycin 6-kinase